MEPMDYVFLLDISGSMARDDKLGISRKVWSLSSIAGPEDRFDCLAFNVAPTPLFKHCVRQTRRISTSQGVLSRRNGHAAAPCCSRRFRPPTRTAMMTAR